MTTWVISMLVVLAMYASFELLMRWSDRWPPAIRAGVLALLLVYILGGAVCFTIVMMRLS
jgi:hypothetical protein